MPVTSVTQDEVTDALGNVSSRYTATFDISDPPFSGTVTVDGGPDWADRLIAAIQDEAARARQVGGAGV